MTLKLRVIIFVCMLMAVIYIFHLIRRKRLDFRYGLGWLFIVFCISLLIIWPVFLDKLAAFLGIASPMNMLFFFGFCFAVMVIFSLSMTISHLADKVKKLSQEIAIIRKDMYQNYQNILKEQESSNGKGDNHSSSL